MERTLQKNLNSLLEIAKEKVKNSSSNLVFYNEFIAPISVCNVKDNVIYVKVKNIFAKQTLNIDYKKKLETELNNSGNTNYILSFITENEAEIESATKNTKQKSDGFIFTQQTKSTGINNNYRFDNFIVSEFNKTAYNAAQTVFKDKFWNPIFISGGVGLGKTHLLYAIGNQFINHFPNKIVKYISTDDFVREVYNSFSIGGNSVEQLKEKYESYDLLLLDDIQFLEKKEKINEIFFNIFNKNISSGKIIVMTSDKEPSLLQNLEARMKSRFHSGLYIKITRPDLNSVKKILEEKIKESNETFILTSDVINYICRRYCNDIRELEGFLHRILFYAINNNLPPNAIINLDMIRKINENENRDNMVKYGFDVNPEIVINQICAAYSINPELVKSKNRTKQISLVRQVCMYVLRQKFNMNYSQIGSFFLGRDHSTVMESIENITKKIKKDSKLEEFIVNLYKKI